MDTGQGSLSKPFNGLTLTPTHDTRHAINSINDMSELSLMTTTPAWEH